MREFRKTTGRNVKGQVWFIGIDLNDTATYISQWGVVGGKMQSTSDTPGTCGVMGHSDYQTAEQYALVCIERDVRKKLEEGYVEYVDDKPTTIVSTAINFQKQLPKNLCLYKPQTEISNEKLLKLQMLKRAIWTLKRDGMMHVCTLAGEWTVYSRRMDVVTNKYPHIIKSLNKLDLPDYTILAGEIVLSKSDGSDNFKGVSKICRSKDDLALAYQGLGKFPKNKKDEQVIGQAGYYVFDCPFYNGEDIITNTPVKNRMALIKSMFSKFDNTLSIDTGVSSSVQQLKEENKKRDAILQQYHIGPIKIYKTDADNDLRLAKQLNIEGFVVFDSEALFNSKAYNFGGKAQRPNGVFKRKPKCEDEFVITAIYEGTGRNRGKLGGFFIDQIHPTTGEHIDCGKVGGGFSDDQRVELFNSQSVGKTIKVEYDSRQPEKDGVYAVRFPVFKGFSDKTPNECIAQDI